MRVWVFGVLCLLLVGCGEGGEITSDLEPMSIRFAESSPGPRRFLLEASLRLGEPFREVAEEMVVTITALTSRPGGISRPSTDVSIRVGLTKEPQVDCFAQPSRCVWSGGGEETLSAVREQARLQVDVPLEPPEPTVLFDGAAGSWRLFLEIVRVRQDISRVDVMVSARCLLRDGVPLERVEPFRAAWLLREIL